MEEFTVVYAILKTLQKAMDTGLDVEDLSAETLGVTEHKRVMLFQLLMQKGYVAGVKEYKTPVIYRMDLSHARITFEGLEFLDTNSKMAKVKKVAGELKDVVPLVSELIK